MFLGLGVGWRHQKNPVAKRGWLRGKIFLYSTWKGAPFLVTNRFFSELYRASLPSTPSPTPFSGPPSKVRIISCCNPYRKRRNKVSWMCKPLADSPLPPLDDPLPVSRNTDPYKFTRFFRWISVLWLKKTWVLCSNILVLQWMTRKWINRIEDFLWNTWVWFEDFPVISQTFSRFLGRYTREELEDVALVYNAAAGRGVGVCWGEGK